MQTDVENWLAWQWRGKISIANTYPASTMTWYPSTADRINDFGRGGRSLLRTGDWAEAVYGNLGNNINDSLILTTLLPTRQLSLEGKRTSVHRLRKVDLDGGRPFLQRSMSGVRQMAPIIAHPLTKMTSIAMIQARRIVVSTAGYPVQRALRLTECMVGKT
jgi:hypothetical protein